MPKVKKKPPAPLFIEQGETIEQAVAKREAKLAAVKAERCDVDELAMRCFVAIIADSRGGDELEQGEYRRYAREAILAAETFEKEMFGE